jgi:dTDP-4-amino-4,6-dideoxygalactose transaminase
METHSRRKFIKTAGSGTLFVLAAGSMNFACNNNVSTKLALLGGNPVRKTAFPGWPIWDENDEKAILPVLRSGVWSRANMVAQAEEKFSQLMGSKYCLLTSSGTQALITSLRALGVEGGDEVITTPYTFIASVDAIFLNNALPVFVDIDPNTWQIEPDKIEDAVTKDTKVVLPVHILGGLSQMDKINALAGKYGLKVLEDACEAHLAEWKGKKAGTLGDLGCFSLQNGKQLTCGEGGVIIGNDEKIMDICRSFHDFGRVKGKYMPTDKGAMPILGTKCRMTEYQASIVMTQMESLKQETITRSENAAYLTSKLETIPGIVPRKEYPETNQTSFYFYGFRFKEEVFGISRDTFIKALVAEGIPVNSNLGVIEGKPLHQEGLIESVTSSKTFRKLYSKERLESYRNSLSLPVTEQLVKETVGIKNQNLLGTKSDMDDIYRAILKIYENRKDLKG